MSIDRQIEEILLEASALGLRNSVINRVNDNLEIWKGTEFEKYIDLVQLYNTCLKNIINENRAVK